MSSENDTKGQRMLAFIFLLSLSQPARINFLTDRVGQTKLQFEVLPM
jgi:hypothetical protein